MPVLSKATSANGVQPHTPSALTDLGGFFTNAIPTTELVESYVYVCAYGRNRCGKTTLACEFPKPLLLVSLEPEENGGATSVANVPGITLERVRHFSLKGRDGSLERVYGTQKFVGMAEQLKKSNPFKTVVIDGAVSLQDICLCEIAGLTKVPEMLKWGGFPEGTYQLRAEKLRESLRPWLELRCNIVVLAQEKDHAPPPPDRGKHKLLETMQQGSFMAPAIGDTNALWLQNHCGYILHMYEDEVVEYKDDPNAGRLEIRTGKRQRFLRLLYHPQYAAGGRWSYGKDVPEFVTAPTPTGLYRAMVQYIPSLKV